MQEQVKCKEHHIWSETTESMEGKPCDCGKMLWHEELCGCPGEKHMEFKPIENPDYKGSDN